MGLNLISCIMNSVPFGGRGSFELSTNIRSESNKTFEVNVIKAPSIDSLRNTISQALVGDTRPALEYQTDKGILILNVMEAELPDDVATIKVWGIGMITGGEPHFVFGQFFGLGDEKFKTSNGFFRFGQMINKNDIS